MIEGIDGEVRRIVASHGRLSVDVDGVGPQDNLYQLGMTSHAALTVMLAIEETFDIEFSDDLLERSIFESFSAMGVAISGLVEQRRTA